MRLTLHTDFALRVLIQVGLNDGKLTTINDIAQSFGISKPHLMKVVNFLGQRGYLDTVRGRNGGIRLMREPRHINVGQVVRDTEDQLAVIGCLERKGYCPIQRICVLRGDGLSSLPVSGSGFCSPRLCCPSARSHSHCCSTVMSARGSRCTPRFA
ncbi:MAG: Rrf2 family transcriptional regulator [Xanthobacteraceae bacterium]